MEPLTVKQFAKQFNLSETYVRHCCNGYVNPVSGRRYALPEGWRAEKAGREGREYWLISREKEPGNSDTDPVNSFIRLALENELSEISNGAAKEDLISSVIFAQARRQVLELLLDERMQNSLRDTDKKKEMLKQIDKTIETLQTDSSISKILAERWQQGIEVKELEDLKKPNGFLSHRGQEFQNSADFQTRIGACYRAAVRNNKTVRVELEFLPDGSWSFNGFAGTQSTLGHYLQNAEADNDPAKEFEESLPQLFRATWQMQIFEKQRAQSEGRTLHQRFVDHWFQTPVVQAHTFREDMLKRCLHCGQYHNKTRKDARFCSDEHKAAHSDWVHEQSNKPRHIALAAIEKKLASILPTISPPAERKPRKI